MKILALSFTASRTLAAPYLSERDTPSLGFYIALQSTGIVEVAFDPTRNVDNSLSISGYTTNAGYKPGWVTSRQDRLYSISRTYFPDNTSISGGLFLFGQTTTTRNLTLLGAESSNGQGGVHCDISPDGTTLSAANIEGSSVAIYPLAEDGTIGSSSHVFQYNLTRPGPGTNESQINANPHQAVFDPSGHFLFVPDRGSDQLYVYFVDGPHRVRQTQNITLPPGTGPRHVTFKQVSSTRSYMYLIGELDNTVRVFTVNSKKSSLGRPESKPQQPTIKLRQTISTVGANRNRTDPNNHDLAAGVYVTNDGNFPLRVEPQYT